MQDFTNAAECYEQLTQLHPEVEDYKLYYAQSLYGACAFPEAMKATFLLDSTASHTKVTHLLSFVPSAKTIKTVLQYRLLSCLGHQIRCDHLSRSWLVSIFIVNFWCLFLRSIPQMCLHISGIPTRYSRFSW